MEYRQKLIDLANDGINRLTDEDALEILAALSPMDTSREIDLGMKKYHRDEHGDWTDQCGPGADYDLIPALDMIEALRAENYRRTHADKESYPRPIATDPETGEFTWDVNGILDHLEERHGHSMIEKLREVIGELPPMSGPNKEPEPPEMKFFVNGKRITPEKAQEYINSIYWIGGPPDLTKAGTGNSAPGGWILRWMPITGQEAEL